MSKSEDAKTKARLRSERRNIVEDRAGSLEEFEWMAAEADTIAELSRRIETNRDVIYNLLDEFDIDFETMSDRLARVTESRLRDLYCKQKMSQQEVANELGVSRGYVQDRMEDYGIEARGVSDYKRCGPDSHGPETRRKMRLSAIKRIQRSKGQLAPRYNENACEVIDQFTESEGYDFQHAENGGEFYVDGLGYWLDGYDPEANVAIEVDESHHFENGRLCERDRRRQQEIMDELGCDFIRIRPDENEPYLDTR